LSGIALCPDYSDSVPVAQVYRYYVEKSLARSPSSDSLPLLFFLFHSGIGLFPDQAISQASWTPNCPEYSRLLDCRFALILGQPAAAAAAVAADRGLSRHYAAEPPAAITDTSLSVFGARISLVKRLENIPCETSAGSRKLRSYLQDFVSRNPVYSTTGIPGFQAFFRVLLQMSGALPLRELLATGWLLWECYMWEDTVDDDDVSWGLSLLLKDRNFRGSVNRIKSFSPAKSLAWRSSKLYILSSADG